MRQQTKFRLIAFAASTPLVIAAAASDLPAAPVDFQIVSQSCAVDTGAGAATFRITFDRVPDFSRADHHQTHTFQYEIDADSTNFDQPMQFGDVDAVIRGGEIWEGQGIPVRDREGMPDDNSGGWGPVRALIPFAEQAETVSFTVGLSALNDTDGHFRYRVFTTENGGLTSEAVGLAVPLPLGVWSGLSVLGGLGFIHRLRRRDHLLPSGNSRPESFSR